MLSMLSLPQTLSSDRNSELGLQVPAFNLLLTLSSFPGPGPQLFPYQLLTINRIPNPEDWGIAQRQRARLTHTRPWVQSIVKTKQMNKTPRQHQQQQTSPIQTLGGTDCWILPAQLPDPNPDPLVSRAPEGGSVLTACHPCSYPNT